VQAQLVIPFDLRGSLAISSERSKTGQSQQRVNYSRSVPTEGGSVSIWATPRVMAPIIVRPT
jgi:hypothetical protein